VLTEGAVSQFGPRAAVLQTLAAPRVRLLRATPEQRPVLEAAS